MEIPIQLRGRPMMKKAALIILLAGIALSRMSAQQPETVPPAQPPAAAQEAPSQPALPAQPASPAQAPNAAQPASPAQPQPAAQPALQAQVPSAAQTPNGAQPANNGTGTTTFRISARLVVLDKVVVDGKGAIVKDLKRDNFKVEEAGQPQTILNFDVAGAHTPSPEITINSTAELDRLAPNAPVYIPR